MTVLTRGGRARRGGRRPGWLLLTVLLVLAIAASSALVFTNEVELLKLAVILSLWAAVVAAFVSVIYRRQSDMDQAKARDLKLVYDLQLDREISARREYELTVESQLRSELSSELRAQAADEVAGLRAELAALRANLEILFNADLSDRPAIETDRTTVRAYSDWPRDAETTGRVASSRIDADMRDDDIRTEESPIIDVPAEPQLPDPEWAAPADFFGGAHRRAWEAEATPEESAGRRRRREETPNNSQPAQPAPPAPPPPVQPVAQPVPPPQPVAPPPPAASEPPYPWLPPTPEPPRSQEPAPVTRQVRTGEWQPAPAEGQFIPPGAPGSNWVSPVEENGSAGDYVGRRRPAESASAVPPAPPAAAVPPAPPAAAVPPAPPAAAVPPAPPAAAVPPAPPAAAVPPAPPAMSARADELRGRHSAPPDATDPGRPAAPMLAMPQVPSAPEPPPRHGGAEETEDAEAQNTGGHSVAELLARMGVGSNGAGGGRRRRED